MIGRCTVATATAALRMPEDLAIRYDRLAKSTGRTKTFYMTEALAAEIDRLEYEYGLLKKVEDYRAGRLETVTLDELEESLGLNPAPPSVAQPKRTAPKKSEKV